MQVSTYLNGRYLILILNVNSTGFEMSEIVAFCLIANIRFNGLLTLVEWPPKIVVHCKDSYH